MTEIEMNSYAVGHMQGHDSIGAAQPTDLPGNGHAADVRTESSEKHGGHVVQASQNDGHENNSTPSLDIFINNVVCTFSVRCHLNLHRIGLEGINVEHRKEYGKVTMRFRNPRSTATMWSSGKVTMTGNDCEQNAKLSARRCARALQKIGFRVRFSQYKVVNVLGTTALPFGIRITEFSREYPREASYEPELHPAVTYRIKSPKATLKIFSTGSITCTAPSVNNVQSAIEHIYPLVETYKVKMTAEQLASRGNQSKNTKSQQQRKRDCGGAKNPTIVVKEEDLWDDEDGDSEDNIEEDMYSGSDDSDF